MRKNQKSPNHPSLHHQQGRSASLPMLQGRKLLRSKRLLLRLSLKKRLRQKIKMRKKQAKMPKQSRRNLQKVLILQFFFIPLLVHFNPSTLIKRYQSQRGFQMEESNDNVFQHVDVFNQCCQGIHPQDFQRCKRVHNKDHQHC